ALGNVGEAAEKAVPDLVKLLQDPDPDLRKNAALALGGIGKGAAEAIPLLVNIMADGGTSLELRIGAADALNYMGNVPANKQHLTTILRVMGDAGEDGDLRLRLAWLFNIPLEQRDKATMEAAKATLTQVCGEAGTKKNTALRYQCAFLATAVAQ